MKKCVHSRRTSTSWISAILCLCTFAGVARAQGLPAFPGAVGFGATATGGRGGDVYHVTRLEDDGAVGSLRHGVESATGPRTIVFEVAGTIELNSSLRIVRDNLTLAGQTAPGGGITLAKYPTIIQGRDIVVRFLRFRTGDFNAQLPVGVGDVGVPGVGNGNANLIGNSGDGLTVTRSIRVILDHVSVSWSLDETLSVTVSKDVTVQHSIISESLNDSFHDKGPHGYGSLVRGEVTPEERAAGTGGFTFYGNLWAHHAARNPALGSQTTLEPEQSEEERRGLDCQFVNNVVYDWGARSSHTVGGFSNRVNYRSNYLIAGPSTEPEARNVMLTKQTAGFFEVFHAGNLIDSNVNGDLDGVPATEGSFSGIASSSLLTEPYPYPRLDVLAAQEAYQSVVAQAGSALARDAIDARIVSQLEGQGGGIINSQDEVGGLPEIAPGEVPLDSDRDGMPDAYELEVGLAADDPADGNGHDLSLEGFTNLEVYLDQLALRFRPTRAGFTATFENGGGVNELAVDATSSTTEDGRTIVAYEWDFGDGSTAEGAAVSHVYEQFGWFTVELRVRDNRGVSASAKKGLLVPFPNGDTDPWASLDMGEPELAGDGALDGECLALYGSGLGVDRRTNQLSLLYQEATGDVALTVRVADLTSVDDPSSGGVMLRTTLEADGPFAAMIVETAGGERSVRFVQRRSRLTRDIVAPVSSSAWLRIRREGDTFIGLQSEDGVEFTEVGREDFNVGEVAYPSVFVSAAPGLNGARSAFVRVCEVSVQGPELRFLRSDCDGDGSTCGDVSDAVRLLEWLFSGGSSPPCSAACDSDVNGTLNISDAVFGLGFCFLGGAAPEGPFPACGDSSLATDIAHGCATPTCP